LGGVFARVSLVLQRASNDANIGAGKEPMRTTIAFDDDLVRTAQEYTGLVEKSALVREALKALIEREAARRLAALGGASPDMAYIPRRRAKAE
jgi:Arc/MetJ family transcription regulator